MNTSDTTPYCYYGGPEDPTDKAIWCALRDHLCPGYRICRYWIGGGSCCGAAARQAVADWKRDNG